MNNELLEMEFEELSDHFGFKIDFVKKTYEELLSKKCVQNGDEDKLLECLYEVLLEKSMTVSRAESFKAGEKYASTNDYIINKVLKEVYGDDAYDDLSDAYIDYTSPKEGYIDYNDYDDYNDHYTK